ncbi:MAG TPA: anhydro-N-acetylmuramic acid kinase [Alphaproteobacteria bacterium]|jgi:anhydro-N-acetylmuramic acid kinase|nr:anhydro-N-acetylmuramic acid kinase [Alphaproteobacteria bacterium]
MANSVWAIGLMSGTSTDGVDAALIETDGIRVTARGPALTLPYTSEFRKRLRSVFGDAADPAVVGEVEAELTDVHAEAVRRLLGEAGRTARDIAVVGFHGQTVHHAPALGVTRQIGDGARLARAVGVNVVTDFRSADMAAGGEGAPLAPMYHLALSADLPRPLAVLNIGGVANVTWIGASDPGAALEAVPVLAFDTGPGNALLDDWADKHLGEPIDRGGKLAGAGHVNEAVLSALLDDGYYERLPPKSLDRPSLEGLPVARLSAADGAATLVAFTAATVGISAAHFPQAPTRWLVTGGGRHNPVLMSALKQILDSPVASVEDAGWDGDALEAQAFAFLAVRALHGLPLSLPAVTGARQPVTGGKIHRVR